eukprot:1853870-Pyramimonas_sp.AAC.1
MAFAHDHPKAQQIGRRPGPPDAPPSRPDRLPDGRAQRPGPNFQQSSRPQRNVRSTQRSKHTR